MTHILTSCRRRLHLFCLGLLVTWLSTTVSAQQNDRAAWMEGKWGIRILLPGGETAGLNTFEVEDFMTQVKQLDSISWVMLNLTHGACGSLYTAPHPELDEKVHPAMTPDRDLLGELIAELKKEDLRVLMYFAAEGPAQVKEWSHPLEKLVPGSFEKWGAYCQSLGMSSQEAIAEKIIKYFAKKYGDGIDGWWFDHARYGDSHLYTEAVRAGNPNAVVSFNSGHTGQVARGAKEEDVAFGHPTPMAKKPPSWKGNLSMIETIEQGPYVDGVLGHLFIPMQRMWWGKEAVFTTEQATEWTRRTLKAGGAFTWAVALTSPHNASSVMAEPQFNQLLEIDRAIKQVVLPK